MVEHLQKLNIVHRDLATRNVLLSDDRQNVVLTDFGLARTVDMIESDRNLTDTITVPVTSPPEAWTGPSIWERYFGFKTDVWGIAMTIFEIVNKRSIGSDLTWMERIEGTKAIKPKCLLRDDIAIGNSFTREKELWFLMCRCWNKDPDERPQISDVFEEVNNLVRSPLCASKRDYVSEKDSDWAETKSNDNKDDDDRESFLFTIYSAAHGLSDNSDKELSLTLSDE